MNIHESVQQKITAADERLNKLQGVEANDVNRYITTLMEHKNVEAGYQQQCGSTHHTQLVFNEFVKIIRLLQKDGFTITEERVKQPKGYATRREGLWCSMIFRLVD